jgi:hypothetical protein
MQRPRYERVSRLRRFVARRAKGPTGDAASLVAEATRLMLLPSLQDVLGEAGIEPLELRLTYAASCVILADILAQRFAPREAEETAAAAIRRIGDWSGLDDAQLTARATAAIKQLMETHPEVYRGLCTQFEDAVERSIVMQRPAQGEVLVRLALESFEAIILRLVLGRTEEGRTPSLLKSTGLLKVVTRRPAPEPANQTDPASAPGWSFMRLGLLGRRPARKEARSGRG